jgi:hypothetical protein
MVDLAPLSGLLDGVADKKSVIRGRAAQLPTCIVRIDLGSDSDEAQTPRPKLAGVKGEPSSNVAQVKREIKSEINSESKTDTAFTASSKVKAEQFDRDQSPSKKRRKPRQTRNQEEVCLKSATTAYFVQLHCTEQLHRRLHRKLL